ncbi:MAG: XRE family transcriptional regulator [Alphaproteobacteria bacterium]|nr:XRE family transcriptional regulator [Alphaproteobacteria bacterium]
MPLELAADARTYEVMVAGALRNELGGSHKAIKTLMRWTGASARTAKNWLAGTCGPSGAHFVYLMKHSDVLFNEVLAAAGRRRASSAEAVGTARILLAEALALLN